MIWPNTKDKARTQGLARFFTGKPCVRGHVAPRYVSTSGCVKCLAENASSDAGKAWRRNWDKTRIVGPAEKARRLAQDRKRMRTDVRKSYSRELRLRKKYGLSADQFKAMWELQKGACAICETTFSLKTHTKQSCAVDHDHNTGAVRALLCNGCNHGIGNFVERPEVMRAAATYIEAHRG